MRAQSCENAFGAAVKAKRPRGVQTRLKAVEPAAAHGLIDTGAILAILDRDDRWHRVCSATYNELRLPLLTSEAVLTETFHLIGDSSHAREAVWDFVMSGAIHVCAISHDELPAIWDLMRRYADRPMDFADATLVYLAKRESLTTILTVDHADFCTYRIEGKRGFRVLPTARP